jgi:hypothetical protein
VQRYVISYKRLVIQFSNDCLIYDIVAEERLSTNEMADQKTDEIMDRNHTYVCHFFLLSRSQNNFLAFRN